MNMSYAQQLDEYQEQPYLADPFLSDLVSPVVDAIKAHARTPTARSTTRIFRLSSLLYHYVKFRGSKTISRSTWPSLDLSDPNGPSQQDSFLTKCLTLR